MDNPIMMDVNPDEAAIDECIAAMKLANTKMASDQAEIERLKAETRAMLTELKAALSSSDSSKWLCSC